MVVIGTTTENILPLVRVPALLEAEGLFQANSVEQFCSQEETFRLEHVTTRNAAASLELSAAKEPASAGDSRQAATSKNKQKTP